MTSFFFHTLRPTSSIVLLLTIISRFNYTNIPLKLNLNIPNTTLSTNKSRFYVYINFESPYQQTVMFQGLALYTQAFECSTFNNRAGIS